MTKPDVKKIARLILLRVKRHGDDMEVIIDGSRLFTVAELRAICEALVKKGEKS